MVILLLLLPNWKESYPIVNMWKAHIGRPDSVICLTMVLVCPKSEFSYNSLYYKWTFCIYSSTSFISSQRHEISGIIPPSWYLYIPSPTRSFNTASGSLAPPCCKNFVLKANPVVDDSGSSWHTFFHMVAAKHLAYK